MSVQGREPSGTSEETGKSKKVISFYIFSNGASILCTHYSRKGYFHCYLIQNQFIYTRFSLTNNVQVEVISSLLEKTTDSMELQHLLEAQVCLITLLFRSSHLNRGVLESKQNNEDQYSGSSLQHEINFHPLNQLTGNTSII